MVYVPLSLQGRAAPQIHEMIVGPSIRTFFLLTSRKNHSIYMVSRGLYSAARLSVLLHQLSEFASTRVGSCLAVSRSLSHNSFLHKRYISSACESCFRATSHSH